jgi:hypothetical protein
MSVIPVREGGIQVLRDILTTSPSLQVIAATDLKSTNVNSSPVIYAHASTNHAIPGTKFITFEALRATETTGIAFTPTKIRGIRTSFSHIVPSTIYNIQYVTTQIVEPVDQNQLLSKLLLQLIGGQLPSDSGAGTNPLAQNPFLGLGLGSPAEPATQFKTHTSTYVTTVTNTESTVLPIILRGRKILTTVVSSTTEVVTATEFSTETVIRPTAALGGGGGGATAGFPDFQQQLLSAQLQQQLQQQQLQQQQQQQLFNQQILSQINLDPNLFAGAIAAASAQEIVATPPPAIEPSPPTPITSLTTKFVSGKRPGDFSIIVSTVILEQEEEETEERKRREAGDDDGGVFLRPSPVQRVEMTADPREGLAEIESSIDQLRRRDVTDNDVVFELQSGMEDLTAVGTISGEEGRRFHVPTQALLQKLA